MKLKNTFLMLLAATSLFSCKNEYVAPNEFSDVGWQIGQMLQNKNPIYMNINQYLTFSDVSQGVLSHQWIVSEEGVKFITADIMPSDETDFEQYIDETIPYTNDETTIHLLLTEPGVRTVRLRNTFAEKVAYYYRPDPDNDKYNIDTTESVFVDGVYLFDTTFVVDVYDPVLVPGVKVYRDRACTQEVEVGEYGSESFPTVEVPCGDSLFFVDNSYDRPNSFKWECEEAGYYAITDSVAAMGFTVANTQETAFNVTQTIERVIIDPDNEYLPTAEPVTATVPLNIVVVER